MAKTKTPRKSSKGSKEREPSDFDALPVASTPLTGMKSPPITSGGGGGGGAWPCFLGPNRDNQSQETGLLKQWPETGPPHAWTTLGLGQGYSNVSIANGTIFTMGTPGNQEAVLAIDLEGSEICDWATVKGMTCVVLKYRVPQTWWHADCHCQRQPKPFLPLQDAQRAMGLLRQRAANLGVDPHKIGVIGFSAGGHLVTAISNATGRSYTPVDAADALSARPDFTMALYPGHLWTGTGTDLFPFDPVRADGPPTFRRCDGFPP